MICVFNYFIYFTSTLFFGIVVSDSVSILIRNENHHIQRFGDLAYNNTYSEFFIDKEHVSIIDKEITMKEINDGDHVCVGYESTDEAFNCFSYKEFISGACVKFTILLQEDGSLISYNFGFQDCVNREFLVDTSIINPFKGSTPTLKKFDVKEKSLPKPAAKKDASKASNKNRVKEDIAEETFFQKYWMFLVPLGIMLVFSGSSNKSE